MVISDKSYRWLIVSLIGLSIIPRLINLDQSLLDIQPFRQTQTAMTVWMYIKEGVSFFNYQTPIFGPPFFAPFEFPVYQFCAYLLYQIGPSDIEIATRITTILFYILSCYALVKVLDVLFSSKSITLFTLLHFCFTPFSLNWSRATTIEYCALFFCLMTLYFYLLSRTSNRYNSFGYLLLFGLFSCLAFTIKLTTAYPYVIFMFLMYGYDLLNLSSFSFKTVLNTFLPLGLKAFIFFFLPFICMYLWVRHTDLLKMESTFSYVTTSSSLKEWNFGSWSDKLSIDKWNTILLRINHTLLPWPMLMPLIGYFFGPNFKQYGIKIMLLMVIPFLKVGTFFNLYYQHDYYLVAVLPFISVVFALSMVSLQKCLWVPLFKKNVAVFYSSVCVLFIFVVYNLIQTGRNNEYLRYLDIKGNKAQYEQYTLGRQIAKATHPEELVIITDFEWSSEVLYSAKRKGLMWTSGNEHEFQRYRGDLKKGHYSLIVSKYPQKYAHLLSSYSIKRKYKLGKFYFFQID
jgi:hypothetical protein